MPEQGRYPEQFGYYEGGGLNAQEFEMSRANMIEYMSQNAQLRKETYDANAQIAQQNWDAYNEYFQEMSKLRQQVSDLEFKESDNRAQALIKGDYSYATPLPIQQKLGQLRNQIQTLDAANFQTAPAETGTRPAAAEQAEPAVGVYNPELDSAQPFGYRAPVAAETDQPFVTPNVAIDGVATKPIDIFGREALAASVPGGYFNQTNQVTTSATDEFGNPITGPSGGGGVYGEGGTVLNPELGIANRNQLDIYEGPGDIPGVPTPGFRGFATYDDLRRGMEEAGRPRDEYGRVNTGVFQPWDFQAMYEGQYSEPDSLQQYLGGARGRSYRGLMRQRADMGQGIQDYRVRRDAYGNVRSFTPDRSSQLTPDERLFRRY